MPSDLKIFLIIGAVVATLFFLASGINQIFAFMDRHKEKPSPPDTYQTMAVCRATHVGVEDRLKRNECAIEAIREQFESTAKELNHDDETRCVALHNRLNKVESECLATTRSIDLLSGRLAQMDSKLDRLMETKKDK